MTAAPVIHEAGNRDEAGASRITLIIPADIDQIQLARLVAAGLASRLNFDFDEIEDLKIGVDELCVAILANTDNASTLHLEYDQTEAGIEVRGTLPCRGNAAQPALGRLTAQIVAAVVDHYELTEHADGRAFRLVKQRRGTP